MNPFEKIFSYRLLARLDRSGTMLLTAHERSWLKTGLDHPDAALALKPASLERLRRLLQEDPPLQTEGAVIEKARSREAELIHPLLPDLRRQIDRRSGVRLSYRTKKGTGVARELALPLRLEYSMVKREWYVHWYHLRRRMQMSTRLRQIEAAEPAPLPPGLRVEALLARLQAMQQAQTHVAIVEVPPMYNKELSRILYAFSCFERAIEYEEEEDRYRIRLDVPQGDSEYFLSRLRFLGRRVRVVEGDLFRRRMLESCDKALARYGVEALQEDALAKEEN